MCGIAAIVQRGSQGVQPQDIQRMTSAIAQRGPDDVGHILIANQCLNKSLEFGSDVPTTATHYDVALGNRRLAILDLSPFGHQPMSFNGYTVSYNGEIYNYLELAEELKRLGHSFVSRSDTEVLLHAFAEWGEACLQRLNGIFAFALWDPREQVLFCARDRLGVKPLYYAQNASSIILCSEIKGILVLMQQKPSLNEALVYDFIVSGSVDHTEETFFNGVKRLPAGTFLKISDGDLKISRYWSLPRENSEPKGSLDENAQYLHDLFHDAIRLQMRSDVPVGCCLSGGLDSSSVASVASSLSSRPMKVFTARFLDRTMDEWCYAQTIHNSKNVEPFSVFATGEEFWEELSNLALVQEEPFSGPGVFAQWRLMKFIKEHGVRVVLDGQGADELFCGYAKYFYLHLWELRRKHDWGSILTSSLDALVRGGSHLFEVHEGRRYLSIGLGWQQPAEAILTEEFRAKYRGKDVSGLPGTVIEQQLLDITTGSLPVLLRYEDKNSMSHSIESRVPFLDHRLVEFALQIPTAQKLDKTLSKVVLRQALKEDVPPMILDRRSKLGFGRSYKSWLKLLQPELRAWLDEKQLPIDAFVDRRKLRLLVRRHDVTVFRPLILDTWLRVFRML